jgi:hypothetical protein
MTLKAFHQEQQTREKLEVIDERNRLCKILPSPPFPKEGV